MSSHRTAQRVPGATGPGTEVDLADGTPALVWPLLDTDGEALQRGYAELSSASRRSRFLTEPPELSDSLLRLLVDEVDGVDHVAVVLTAYPAGGGARPVGVARLVRHPGEPEVADVAVTVLDAWQGRGVGRALLAAVLDRRPRGVVRLRTAVAAGNRASLRMLGRVGQMTTRHEGAGQLTVAVTDLPPAA
ncbi:N-acetyltransferase family protein [Geodermatophilus sp. URMC 62]|uniref:N-acetyltransferase family protein n=1 Tax=Geodermatophilus sp. URMC 62 TaxID=3423414 RepID=UPI00406D16FE